MTTFPTPGPIRARITLAWGDVRLEAVDDGSTVVEVTPTDPASDKDRRAADETRVRLVDGLLEVTGPQHAAFIGPTKRSGSVQVAVRLPSGSALEVRTALGRIETVGAFGEVGARTSAGDLRVPRASSADLRTGIGSVDVGEVAGDLRCTTGTGAVSVERVDGQAAVRNSNGSTWIGVTGTSTRVKAANGDIAVERARGDLMATTANGALRVGSVEQGEVMLRTSVGRIDLGVPHGTVARLDLRTGYGSVRNDLEATSAPTTGERSVHVDAQTSAGDIDVVRAVVDVGEVG